MRHVAPGGGLLVQAGPVDRGQAGRARRADGRPARQPGCRTRRGADGVVGDDGDDAGGTLLRAACRPRRQHRPPGRLPCRILGQRLRTGQRGGVISGLRGGTLWLATPEGQAAVGGLPLRACFRCYAAAETLTCSVVVWPLSALTVSSTRAPPGASTRTVHVPGAAKNRNPPSSPS